jgi:hypothetical protein
MIETKEADHTQISVEQGMPTQPHNEISYHYTKAKEFRRTDNKENK